MHQDDDDGTALANAIKGTAERGGRVIIPAFAIGLVEELIYWIKRLEDARLIPVLPVFIDSPMAVEALTRYTERLHELDSDLQPEQRDQIAPHGSAARGETRSERKRDVRQERQVAAFATERFRTISSPAESKQLTQSKMPAIIISSSGMATGGRVLHHLKAALPDSRNAVIFVGYRRKNARTSARRWTRASRSTVVRFRCMRTCSESIRCLPTPTLGRFCGGCAASHGRHR